MMRSFASMMNVDVGRSKESQDGEEMNELEDLIAVQWWLTGLVQNIKLNEFLREWMRLR
jgi:hypothetical protein